MTISFHGHFKDTFEYEFKRAFITNYVSNIKFHGDRNPLLPPFAVEADVQAARDIAEVYWEEIVRQETEECRQNGLKLNPTLKETLASFENP